MCPKNPQMCRKMPYVQKSVFFLFLQESAFFQNKPFCTFGKNVATLDCLVSSSYHQLYGIVNLIQILQGVKDCALIMADIPIDRFALSETLVYRSSWGLTIFLKGQHYQFGKGVQALSVTCTKIQFRSILYFIKTRKVDIVQCYIYEGLQQNTGRRIIQMTLSLSKKGLVSIN